MSVPMPYFSMTATFVRHLLASCYTVLKTVPNAQYSNSFFGCLISTVASKFEISAKVGFLGMFLAVLIGVLLGCVSLTAWEVQGILVEEALSSKN